MSKYIKKTGQHQIIRRKMMGGAVDYYSKNNNNNPLNPKDDFSGNKYEDKKVGFDTNVKSSKYQFSDDKHLTFNYNPKPQPIKVTYPDNGIKETHIHNYATPIMHGNGDGGNFGLSAPVHNHAVATTYNIQGIPTEAISKILSKGPVEGQNWTFSRIKDRVGIGGLRDRVRSLILGNRGDHSEIHLLRGGYNTIFSNVTVIGWPTNIDTNSRKWPEMNTIVFPVCWPHTTNVYGRLTAAKDSHLFSLKIHSLDYLSCYFKNRNHSCYKNYKKWLNTIKEYNNNNTYKRRSQKKFEEQINFLKNDHITMTDHYYTGDDDHNKKITNIIANNYWFPVEREEVYYNKILSLLSKKEILNVAAPISLNTSRDSYGMFFKWGNRKFIPENLEFPFINNNLENNIFTKYRLVEGYNFRFKDFITPQLSGGIQNYKHVVNHGVRSEEEWDTMLFTIIVTLNKLLDSGIYIPNISVDNLFVKRVSEVGYWNFKINNIDYYVKNRGYIVIFDLCNKDDILKPSEYFESEKELLRSPENELFSVYLDSIDGKSKEKKSDVIVRILSSIHDQDTVKSTSIGKRIHDIITDFQNNHDFDTIISQRFHMFLHNRIGTPNNKVKSEEIDNTNKDFKKGDMILLLGTGDENQSKNFYKWVVALNDYNNPTIKVIQKSDVDINNIRILQDEEVIVKDQQNKNLFNVITRQFPMQENLGFDFQNTSNLLDIVRINTKD